MAFAVPWGLIGSVPFEARGQGMFLKEGGFFTTKPQGAGQIKNIDFRPGDNVALASVIYRHVRPVELIALFIRKYVLGEHGPGNGLCDARRPPNAAAGPPPCPADFFVIPNLETPTSRLLRGSGLKRRRVLGIVLDKKKGLQPFQL